MTATGLSLNVNSQVLSLKLLFLVARLLYNFARLLNVKIAFCQGGGSVSKLKKKNPKRGGGGDSKLKKRIMLKNHLSCFKK